MAINIRAEVPQISLGLARFAGEGAKQQALFQQAMQTNAQEMQRTQMANNAAIQAGQLSLQRKKFQSDQRLQQQSMQLQSAAVDRAERSLQDQQTRTQLTIRGMDTRDTATAKKASDKLKQFSDWATLENTMTPEEYIRGRVAIGQGGTPARPTTAEGGLTAYQATEIARRDRAETRQAAVDVARQSQAAAEAAEGYDPIDLNRIKDAAFESPGLAPEPSGLIFGSSEAERKGEFRRTAKAFAAQYSVQNEQQARQLRNILAEQAIAAGFDAADLPDLLPEIEIETRSVAAVSLSQQAQTNSGLATMIGNALAGNNPGMGPVKKSKPKPSGSRAPKPAATRKRKPKPTQPALFGGGGYTYPEQPASRTATERYSAFGG